MTQLNSGTVSLTNGSAVATFADTDLVAKSVVVGAWLQLVGEITPLQVASIDSATQATLTAPYTGTTGAGKDYTLSWYFSSVYGFPLPQAGDINAAGLIARAIEEIDAQLGPRVDIVLGGVSDAEAARDKAQEWADNPEDNPVETGPDQFSAKHHALKAGASADAAEGHKDAAAGSATLAGNAAQSASDDADQTALDRAAAAGSAGTASGAATAAQTARDKAEQWAEEAEDTEVETGKFSSLHHAAKAAGSAAAAAAALASLGNVLEYRGDHDASGAAPAATTGHVYRISVAGTVGGLTVKVNDIIFYDGTAWRALGASGAGGGPLFFCQQTPTDTLTQNTWQKLSIDAASIDTDSVLDPVLFRITPPAGTYFLFCGGSANLADGSIGGVAFVVNGFSGGDLFVAATQVPGANSAPNQFALTMFTFDGTDYLELFGYASHSSPTVSAAFIGGFKVS